MMAIISFGTRPSLNFFFSIFNYSSKSIITYHRSLFNVHKKMFDVFMFVLYHPRIDESNS